HAGFGRVVVDVLGDFFFQAEDGIRDRTVTGVQTCALPISASRSSCAFAASEIVRRNTNGVRACAASRSRSVTTPRTSSVAERTRSEERRVGKECRTEWLANQ